MLKECQNTLKEICWNMYKHINADNFKGHTWNTLKYVDVILKEHVFIKYVEIDKIDWYIYIFVDIIWHNWDMLKHLLNLHNFEIRWNTVNNVDIMYTVDIIWKITNVEICEINYICWNTQYIWNTSKLRYYTQIVEIHWKDWNIWKFWYSSK